MPNPPSPSSSSSTTETTIPTPDQPYSSRRSSVASPAIYTYSMSGRKGEDEGGDLFSPSTSTIDEVEGSDTPQPKGRYTSSSLESTMSHQSMNGMVSPTPFSRRRSNTANRAPPPPPIFLRRATGMADDDEDEVVPIPGSASTSSQPGSARGLNIAGLEMPHIASPGVIEDEGENEEAEDNDALPELLASPRPRLNFGNADGAPASPAWQSFEAPPSSGPQSSASWGRKSSLDVPSPLGPRTNEKKSEPTPQHGLHARNLSLYFPQPGSSTLPKPNGSPMLMESPVQPNETLMPSAGGDRNVFGGTGNWSFGQSLIDKEDGIQTPEGVKRSKRRGHHHKHSLSHNFFSFLDPTQTNPNLAASPSPHPAPSPGPEATPAPVPMPRLAPTTINAASPTLSPLPPSKSDHRGQFLLSFAVLEFLIGAGLWIEGQMSGWRCLAGVGYLVVFDAMGVAVEMVARAEGQGWSSVRRPYGPSRYISLLYFAQSLFLVFAAVYIAKESLEQVILGAGAHEHAVGGHGHGNSASEGDERDFPHFLLFCASASSIFAAGALGNHGKLVDAVGSLFLTSSYLSLPFVAKLSSLFANPFSLTIAGASSGILISTLLVPPSALHSLDSFISLVLTILTSALSYPPTVAFAHVLLQTAPPAYQSQMLSLRRALKEIKEDRRIVGLGTMRCWTITAGKGSYEERYPSTPNASRNNSVSGSPRVDRFSFSTPLSSPPARQASFTELAGMAPNSYPSPYGFPPNQGPGWSKDKDRDEGAPLVITLVVHVHPDLADKDVLEVTKFSYLKLEGAVSGQPGMLGRRDGEVSIQIKRGWEGLEDG
ncbi:hypothetical protein I316_03962 [Kwoniella heveanensis BCC8398]|uniref:Uncharacterized protein n=1 Tax=Kwoniella heveanensis BCC8398 TaxID=1296120 RepID=A0A1B9GU07_9TREE|nr:hypothetical protein I316_03962 [Kwoniella heveanensis BCC8398]